jgi:hypothetical protein
MKKNSGQKSHATVPLSLVSAMLEKSAVKKN